MCSQLPNQVLKNISIIDSPGILSGEKQRISRGPRKCSGIQFPHMELWMECSMDQGSKQ
ncbi:EH domain-containing protein 4 [Vulpes lagopus]